MAQTIAEKLLTRNNLKQEPVSAGDFLEVPHRWRHVPLPRERAHV